MSKRLIPGLLLVCAPVAHATSVPVEVPPPDLTWRASAPAPGPDTGWQAPVPERFTLSNGLPVYVVHRPGLPLVSVQVVIEVGREANPDGKAGLASFTTDMLDEGIAGADALALAERVESLGAQLGSSFDGSNSAVGLDALSETLEPSLDLLAEVVMRPAFEVDDLERLKGETLAELEADATDPRKIVRDVFIEEYYGATHPYGVRALGTPESVGSFTVKDVKAFHKKHWHAGNAVLLVAGDLDVAKAKALLEPRFGSWKASKAAPVGIPAAAPPPSSTRIVFVEQPGSVQSVLRIGHAGPTRTSADWWPGQMVASIAGGMFSSRINLNLREEHGWSYGAWGDFVPMRGMASVFQVGTQVQADATAASVREIVDELRQMQAAPASAEELSMAREYLGASLAGFFETNNKVVWTLAQHATLDLPDDELRRLPAVVAGITAEHELEAAKKLLHPNELLIVVVGPATATRDDGTTVDLVKELEGLGLGPVVRR